MRNNVSLRIIGDFSPEEVSERLGILASYQTRRGETHRSGEIAQNHIWGTKSSEEFTENWEEHLEWLAVFCAEHRKELEGITENSKIDAFFSITLEGQGGFHIPAELMRVLGEIGIQVEVSLIAFMEEESDKAH